MFGNFSPKNILSFAGVSPEKIETLLYEIFF
jgi:hypothetical protein